jgi:hypothetical protein
VVVVEVVPPEESGCTTVVVVELPAGVRTGAGVVVVVLLEVPVYGSVEVLVVELCASAIGAVASPITRARDAQLTTPRATRFNFAVMILPSGRLKLCLRDWGGCDQRPREVRRHRASVRQ